MWLQIGLFACFSNVRLRAAIAGSLRQLQQCGVLGWPEEPKVDGGSTLRSVSGHELQPLNKACSVAAWLL